MITHNLLRAASTLGTGQLVWPAAPPCDARSSTSPARLARPQRRPVLHLPAHWPWADRWQAIWTGVFGHALGPPATA